MLAEPGGSSLSYDWRDLSGFKLTVSLESLALFLCRGDWCGCGGGVRLTKRSSWWGLGCELVTG